MEAGARFAFAVFQEWTDVAVQNRLVPRLDYERIARGMGTVADPRVSM